MVWSHTLLPRAHHIASARTNCPQHHLLDPRVHALWPTARAVALRDVCFYRRYCVDGCWRFRTGDRSNFQCHCEYLINHLRLSSLKFCFSQNGCAVGPSLMAPFLGLAIYGFDFAADISPLMNAAMKLSFIRGGIVTLVLTVFGHNRQQLYCKDVYCHFDDPKVLLRYLRIEEFSLVAEIGYLIALMITFRILFYMSLRKRLYK